MSEYGQEDVPRSRDISRISLDRLGECLVNRLVEASNLLEYRLNVSGDGRTTPERQDTCAKRPELADQLRQVEPADVPRPTVARSGRNRSRRPTNPLGFPRTLILTLARLHVLGDRQEDLAGMVAELRVCHCLGRGKQGPGERIPFFENRLQIGFNEGAEFHRARAPLRRRIRSSESGSCCRRLGAQPKEPSAATCCRGAPLSNLASTTAAAVRGRRPALPFLAVRLVPKQIRATCRICRGPSDQMKR